MASVSLSVMAMGMGMETDGDRDRDRDREMGGFGTTDCRIGGSFLFVYNKASEFFTTHRDNSANDSVERGMWRPGCKKEAISQGYSAFSIQLKGRQAGRLDGWLAGRHPRTYLFMQTHNSLFCYFVRAPGNQ